LYPKLRWFDSGTSLSWNIRFLIDQGTPYDSADRPGTEPARGCEDGTKPPGEPEKGIKISREPLNPC
jgi:hypothetical protein